MIILRAILFHLALVFGFGSGLVVFFQLGRFGIQQVLYWLAGTPAQKNPAGREAETICSLLGIPTSSDDLIAIDANVSPIKSAYDLAKYLYGNFGGPLAYLSTVLGRTFGRLWFLVGIPLFLLDVIVAPDYLPPWIKVMGLNKWSFCGILVLGYFMSYSMGSLVAAPQKRFNRGRLIYERQVARHGYWFDYFIAGSIGYDQQELKRARSIYREIREALDFMPVDSSLLRQRQMGLEYQSALLLASLQSYSEALESVRAAGVLREGLKSSSIWETGEYDITKSQMLFLEGELLYVSGAIDAAKDRFSAALVIDIQMKDSAGIEIIEKRLALTERGHPRNCQLNH